MYKTKLKENKTNIVLAVIARYVFAIFIGIAVAHPMTLLWFNDSITESIKLDKNTSLKTEETDFQKDVNDLNKPLEDLRARRNCLNKLLTAERSGVLIRETCGVSSGKTGYAGRAKELERQINVLNTEISDMQALILSRITQVEQGKNNRKSDIEIYTKSDYLKRVKALTKLENGENGEHIGTVATFILLFFIFLDILPITMKLATSYGEYEAFRDSQTFKVTELEDAQREIIKTVGRSAYLNISQAKFQLEQISSEVTEYSKSVNDFTKKQEDESKVFDDRIVQSKKRIRSIKDKGLKQEFAKYIIKSRKIFNLAVTKAQDRFLNYFKEL
jgi:uncharacterized protein YlxW (UPF0749 family)